MTELLLVGTVLVGLAFAFASGLQDASNAVATAITTRALAPRAATRVAAVMALAGAGAGWWLSPPVVGPTDDGATAVPDGATGLAVLLVALAAATAWLLIMARVGMPVSSSHTLVAALVGAAWAVGADVDLGRLADQVLVPMLLSTVVALVVVHLGTQLGRRLGMATEADAVQPVARVVQALATTATAAMLGLLGSARVMLVLGLAWSMSGRGVGTGVPPWMLAATGLALAGGVAVGGRRIIATLGELMVGRTVVRGAAIQTAAVTTFGLVTALPGLPVSMTHTIGAALVGSGLVTPGRMRWGTTVRVLGAWLVTLPAVAVVSGLLAGITWSTAGLLPAG